MSFKLFKRVLGIGGIGIGNFDEPEYPDNYRYQDIDASIQRIFDLIDEVTNEPGFIRRLNYETIRELIYTTRQFMSVQERTESSTVDKEYIEKVHTLHKDLRWLKRMMFSHNTEFVTRQDGKGEVEKDITFYIDETIHIEGFRLRHEKRITVTDRTLVAALSGMNEQLRNCNDPNFKEKVERIQAERNLYNFFLVYFNFHITYFDMTMIKNFISVLDEYENKNKLVYRFEEIINKVKEYYPKTALFYGSYSSIEDTKTETLRTSKEACKKLIDELQNKES